MGAKVKQGNLNESQEANNGQVSPETIQELFEELKELSKNSLARTALLKADTNDDGKADFDFDSDGDVDPVDFEKFHIFEEKIKTITGLYAWTQKKVPLIKKEIKDHQLQKEERKKNSAEIKKITKKRDKYILEIKKNYIGGDEKIQNSYKLAMIKSSNINENFKKIKQFYKGGRGKIKHLSLDNRGTITKLIDISNNHLISIRNTVPIIKGSHDNITKVKKDILAIKQKASVLFQNMNNEPEVKKAYNHLIETIETALGDNKISKGKTIFFWKKSEYKEILDAQKQFHQSIGEGNSKLAITIGQKLEVATKIKNLLPNNKAVQNDYNSFLSVKEEGVFKSRKIEKQKEKLGKTVMRELLKDSEELLNKINPAPKQLLDSFAELKRFHDNKMNKGIRNTGIWDEITYSELKEMKQKQAGFNQIFINTVRFKITKSLNTLRESTYVDSVISKNIGKLIQDSNKETSPKKLLIILQSLNDEENEFSIKKILQKIQTIAQDVDLLNDNNLSKKYGEFTGRIYVELKKKFEGNKNAGDYIEEGFNNMIKSINKLKNKDFNETSDKQKSEIDRLRKSLRERKTGNKILDTFLLDKRDKIADVLTSDSYKRSDLMSLQKIQSAYDFFQEIGDKIYSKNDNLAANQKMAQEILLKKVLQSKLVKGYSLETMFSERHLNSIDELINTILTNDENLKNNLILKEDLDKVRSEIKSKIMYSILNSDSKVNMNDIEQELKKITRIEELNLFLEVDSIEQIKEIKEGISRVKKLKGRNNITKGDILRTYISTLENKSAVQENKDMREVESLLGVKKIGSKNSYRNIKFKQGITRLLLAKGRNDKDLYTIKIFLQYAEKYNAYAKIQPLVSKLLKWNFSRVSIEDSVTYIKENIPEAEKKLGVSSDGNLNRFNYRDGNTILYCEKGKYNEESTITLKAVKEGLSGKTGSRNTNSELRIGKKSLSYAYKNKEAIFSLFAYMESIGKNIDTMFPNNKEAQIGLVQFIKKEIKRDNSDSVGKRLLKNNLNFGVKTNSIIFKSMLSTIKNESSIKKIQDSFKNSDIIKTNGQVIDIKSAMESNSEKDNVTYALISNKEVKGEKMKKVQMNKTTETLKNETEMKEILEGTKLLNESKKLVLAQINGLLKASNLSSAQKEKYKKSGAVEKIIINFGVHFSKDGIQNIALFNRLVKENLSGVKLDPETIKSLVTEVTNITKADKTQTVITLKETFIQKNEKREELITSLKNEKDPNKQKALKIEIESLKQQLTEINENLYDAKKAITNAKSSKIVVDGLNTGQVEAITSGIEGRKKVETDVVNNPQVQNKLAELEKERQENQKQRQKNQDNIKTGNFDAVSQDYEKSLKSDIKNFNQEVGASVLTALGNAKILAQRIKKQGGNASKLNSVIDESGKTIANSTDFLLENAQGEGEGKEKLRKALKEYQKDLEKSPNKTQEEKNALKALKSYDLSKPEMPLKINMNEATNKLLKSGNSNRNLQIDGKDYVGHYDSVSKNTVLLDKESGNLILLSFEGGEEALILNQVESNLLQDNPEGLGSFAHFRNTMREANLLNLWPMRHSIFVGLQNAHGSAFNLGTEGYLSENQMMIFLDSILVSVGDEPSSGPNLKQTLLHFQQKNFSTGGLNDKEDANIYGDSTITDKFIKKFMPREKSGLGFDISKFTKSIKNNTENKNK